jgi:hypothetical protein
MYHAWVGRDVRGNFNRGTYEGFKGIGYVIHVTEHRVQWWAVVNTVTNCHVTFNDCCVECLHPLTGCQTLKKVFAVWC